MPPKLASTTAAAMAGIPTPSTAVSTSSESSQRIRPIHASNSESIIRIPPHATTPTSQSQSQSSQKTLALNSGKINSDGGGVDGNKYEESQKTFDLNNSGVEYCEPEKIIHVEAATVEGGGDGTSNLQSGGSSVDPVTVKDSAAIGVAGSGNGKRKIIRKTVRLVKKVIKKRVPKRVLTSGAENQGVAGKSEDCVNLSEVRDNLGLANYYVIEKSNVVDEVVEKTSVVNEANNVLRMVDDATESSNLVNEKSDHVDMVTESLNFVKEKSDHVDRVTEKTSIIDKVMEKENSAYEVMQELGNATDVSEQKIGKKSKDPSGIAYMESDRSELNFIANSSEPINDLGGINTMETDNIESNDVVCEVDENDLTIRAPDLMEVEKVNDVSGTSMKIKEIENSKTENQSVDFIVETENIDVVNKVDVELHSVQNVSPVGEKGEKTIDKAESGSEVDSDCIGLTEGLLLSGEMEALERTKRHKTEIFVGGLDRDAQEDDIRKVFGEAGVIVEIRLMMSNSGKNRGYAFVRFATEADAKNAVEKYSKAKICGKQCNVAPVEGHDTIFLSNIDRNWKAEDVVTLLEKADIEKMNKVTLKADSNNIKKNRGFAFVEFETCKDAKTALNKLQKKEVFGKTQMVKAAWARPLSEPAQEEILQGTKFHNFLKQDAGVQTSKKQYEPRNQEMAARSSYNHVKVDKRSSTTDELVQILRQQASNKHILSHPRTGQPSIFQIVISPYLGANEHFHKVGMIHSMWSTKTFHDCVLKALIQYQAQVPHPVELVCYLSPIIIDKCLASHLNQSMKEELTLVIFRQGKELLSTLILICTVDNCCCRGGVFARENKG
ncbi:hypothetical protein ACS0TY_016735 [Phlomoides rotata]